MSIETLEDLFKLKGSSFLALFHCCFSDTTLESDMKFSSALYVEEKRSFFFTFHPLTSKVSFYFYKVPNNHFYLA